MKSPTMIMNRYKFKYIQVPYDNRYIVIEYNDYGTKWIQIAIIPSNLTIWQDIAIAITSGDCRNFRSNQMERFSTRMQAYDDYLDRKEK